MLLNQGHGVEMSPWKGPASCLLRKFTGPGKRLIMHSRNSTPFPSNHQGGCLPSFTKRIHYLLETSYPLPTNRLPWDQIPSWSFSTLVFLPKVKARPKKVSLSHMKGPGPPSLCTLFDNSWSLCFSGASSCPHLLRVSPHLAKTPYGHQFLQKPETPYSEVRVFSSSFPFHLGKAGYQCRITSSCKWMEAATPLGPGIMRDKIT